MAKKKKTQLKPVARGFATTSIPKKVAQVEPEPEPEPEPAPTNEPVAEDSTAGFVPVSTLDVEEQALQDLIEKYQDKTERDVCRTIKAIEQERRFSSTLQRLDIDNVFVDRILQLVLDSTPATVTIDDPEEKVLLRLAITYGSLRRLGFSEAQVEECLRTIPGVELDDAIEWLHINLSEDELGTERNYLRAGPETEPRTPRTPQTAMSSTMPTTPQTLLGSETPRTSYSVSDVDSVPTPPSKQKTSRLDASAAEFVPSFKLPAMAYPESPGLADISSGPTDLATKDTTNSTTGRSTPYDDPTLEYVRLKMRITDLTTHRQPGETRDADFLRDLHKRLEDVKQDYFFDERDAEDAFKVERDKADAALLQARLRGELPTPVKPKSTKKIDKNEPKQLPPPISVPEPPSPDVFDDEPDGDTEGGGMFGLLENPSEEVTPQGTTVYIRDMLPPKNWSGRTPKQLLRETVHKLDRHAVVTYRCVSGNSRAYRSAVSVRWGRRKNGDWSMEDVACRDLLQAEQYISTVALHALTYPGTEGFALGGTAATTSQTSFRLLPPIYRDFWNELEEKRRTSDDAINRSVWAKLKQTLGPKLSSAKSSGKGLKEPTDIVPPLFSRSANHTELTPEQIMASFAVRQNGPAYQEMLFHRNKLPIAQHREQIIGMLEMSQILVLSGETGCGKSTQVPAFILEDQLSQGRHCKIYCTEPRRISAISLAQRVSVELGEPAGAVGTLGSVVGYSIRLESNTSKTTRLTYVTNGIALRMLEGGSGQGGQGTAFDEITHIIIDEVHERTIESDFLLIVLKSLLQQRPDLKVILMSATVDANKLSEYFGGCPTLHVPGRTFPVDVRYLEDAVETTGWRIAENSPYAIRGKDKYRRGKDRLDWVEDAAPAEDDDDEPDQENLKLEQRYSASTTATINLFDERLVPYDLIIRLLETICFEDPSYATFSAAILIFMPGLGEIRRLNDLLAEHHFFSSEDQFRIYPLHSTLSSEHQGAVFEIPPPGIRKIVIATNIAETGITIPDITCVIDSGKHREMRFDEKRQISRLVETYVARSNAAQRRGRAGRVQSGLCFHLFTKFRHDNKMADHPDPEMMRLSLSDLALRIKIMKVKLGSSIEDVLSRALDPPLSVNIQRAVSALVEVRALTPSEEITPMGRLLSQLPTDVHLGKFLLIATLFRCLDPALTIAAALSTKSPFLTPLGLADEADRAKRSFRVENSDFLTIHNAFSIWRTACGKGVARKLCKNSFLSHQNLQQIEELRQQFLGYLVDSSFVQVDKAFIRELNRARYSRGRTRFVTVPSWLDQNSRNVALINGALTAGLYPKILSVGTTTKDKKGEMRTITNNQLASFHPSSVNFGRKSGDLGVNYLSYFTLMHSKKLYAWETAPVDDMALLLLCGEAEFKLISNTVIIDRKIKFQIEPKAGAALKFLRTEVGQLLAAQYRGQPLVESQIVWNEIAMMVLGKVKVKGPEEKEETITLVVHRRT